MTLTCFCDFLYVVSPRRSSCDRKERKRGAHNRLACEHDGVLMRTRCRRTLYESLVTPRPRSDAALSL